MKAVLGIINSKSHTNNLKIATPQILSDFSQTEAKLFNHFSKTRQTEIILGRFLAKHLICKKFNLAFNSFKINLTSAAKPKITVFKKDHKQDFAHIHFSISHSKNLVGCAVADFKIGFDIEIINNSAFLDKISRRFFHPGEQIYLNKTNKAERLINFYRLWTIKEADLKLKELGVWEMKGAANINLYTNTLFKTTSEAFNVWFKLNNKLENAIFMLGIVANQKFDFDFCDNFLPAQVKQLYIAKAKKR